MEIFLDGEYCLKICHSNTFPIQRNSLQIFSRMHVDKRPPICVHCTSENFEGEIFLDGDGHLKIKSH